MSPDRGWPGRDHPGDVRVWHPVDQRGHVGSRDPLERGHHLGDGQAERVYFDRLEPARTAETE